MATLAKKPIRQFHYILHVLHPNLIYAIGNFNSFNPHEESFRINFFDDYLKAKYNDFTVVLREGYTENA